MSENTVEVKINPAYHERAPMSAQEDLAWPVLDTVWDMIREVAARVALQQMREALPDGVTMPPDEELIASLDQDCPCGREKHTMVDLSPDNLEGTLAVAAAFGSQVEAVRAALESLATIEQEDDEA